MNPSLATNPHPLAAAPFRWAVGIEGSFIPHLGIDQYEWTQHDRFWREDFHLIADDLHCRWVRYPLPWHEIERAPGVFDWTWTDARFDLADELGLKLMVDLAHFGTPTWLPDAFADPEFPEAIARFSRAFGERYAGRPCVPTVCPVNEPLITALFCGDIGMWPPYGRGLDNYMTVLSRLAQGLCKGIAVLRETMPGVEILICDSLEVAGTQEPDSSEKTSPFLRESLAADVARRMQRRHVVIDLVTGRVDRHHPLHDWLRRHGFGSFDLRWFDRNRQTVDVVGLDYYPHTEVELYTTPEGFYRQRKPENPLGLYRAAQDYWRRYGLPLMITETSVTGSDADKLDWLRRSVDDCRQLRADGFPVIGYTWWPVIDHLDWDGAMLHQTGHIHPVGIYKLERQRDNRLLRAPTGLRDGFRGLIDAGDHAAGPLGKIAGWQGAAAPAGGVASVAGTGRAPGAGQLGFPIVVHSSFPWINTWGRPQQLFHRYQLRHPVLYVDPVQWREEEAPPSSALRAFPHFPNLYVLTLRLPAAWRDDPARAAEEQRRLVAAALNRAPLVGKFARPVQWFDDPLAAPAFLGWEILGARAVVYDQLERWELWPGAPAETVGCEKPLLAAADLVFTRGRRLHAATLAVRPDARLVPDGVDAHNYIRSSRPRTALPHDVEFIKHPTLGYCGSVDWRLDFDLIAAVADADPDWNLIFLGPVRGVDPEHLPRRANIFWLGSRPPERLPDYLKAFDVSILPYHTGGVHDWRVPGKLPEALLAGRPVVSTNLPEVRENFADFVDVADTREAFIQLCHQGLRSPDPKRVRAAMRTVAARSWHKVVAQAEAWLEETLDAKTK